MTDYFVTGEVLRISLPWPPSVNNYWKRTRKGIRVSDKGMEYKITIDSLIEKFNLRMSIDEPIDVVMWYFPPDKRIRDIDNYSKGLFDSLSEAEFWTDDKIIKRMTVEWDSDNKKLGRVDMLVREYDNLDQYYMHLRQGWN